MNSPDTNPHILRQAEYKSVMDPACVIPTIPRNASLFPLLELIVASNTHVVTATHQYQPDLSTSFRNDIGNHETT